MITYLKVMRNKIRNDFYNKAIVKKIVLSASLYFSFIYFQGIIISVIDKYLVADKNYSSPFLDAIVVLCSIITITFFYIKLIRKKYYPSTNEYLALGVLLFITAYYRANFDYNYWGIQNYFDCELLLFKYTDFLIFILSLFYIFNFFRYFFLNKSLVECNTEFKNEIINDDPVYSLEEDKLEYNDVVEKLCQLLLKEKHRKAISIGLIGPWGNGKSSIIHMVEEKIKNDNSFKSDDIISIHFLPYLNHNDDDIINEFFTAFSNELSIYNGKLSSDIITYSKKITDLYKEKNIFSFLESHVTNFKNSSANELYVSINEMLESINKKIVVFIDDLDRLNQTEILQVLKLIRNTANFNNTIFVVAMDKEYVINRLKSSQDILDSKFIDKFFQLEIYLPEIKTQRLKEFFINMLKEQLNPDASSDFSLRIEESINNPDNLFEDYITNFRDVKRTINQIVFDYPFTGGEINFKDFVNFTYFKLKFPQFIKILKENKAAFLDSDRNGFYEFKKKPKEENKGDVTHMFKLMHVKMKRNINLEKYILYDDRFIKDCIVDNSSIDCEDRILFIKTLAFLFGDENKVNDVDSIKYENNFRMLMEQKIYADLFRNTEFKEILNAQQQNLQQLIENLNETKKIQQLLNRIEYYNSLEEENIKRLIIVLLILLEKRNEYQLDNINLINYIEKLIESHLKDIKTEHKFSDWLKETVFESDLLSDSSKLIIIEKLWKFRAQNSLWEIDEKYITKKALNIFEKFIDENIALIPAYNDYSIYAVYHSIKNIGDFKEEVIANFLRFWSPEKNEILCVHMIEMEPFSKSRFKISDVAAELFGSKTNFIEYVKDTSVPKTKGLEELIFFLELCEINRQSGYVVYKFEKSIPMMDKIKANSKNYSDSDDNLTQIFFVTNDHLLSSSVFHDSELKEYRVKTLDYQDLNFIICNVPRKINKSDVIKIAQRISDSTITQNTIENIAVDKKLVFEKENFIPQNPANIYVKLFSVQPPTE